MKVCKGCNINKNKSEFYKNKNLKDGYENKCKECRNSQRKENHKYVCKNCKKTFTSTRKAEYCSVECVSKKRRMTESEFKRRVSKMSGISYVKGFFNSRSKVVMRCMKCDNEYTVTAVNVLNERSSCSKCNGTERLTQSEFIKRVEDVGFGNYEVLSEYTNNKTYVSMRSKECNHVFDILPTHFFSGRRCPVCNMSNGEQRIYDVLNERGLSFETQKRFKGCKNERELPFDFYLDINGREILIEYDGEQHFTPIDIFGGVEYLKEVQRNDQIKNNFAKDNDIELYRIPYTEFKNIEAIIKNILTNQTIPSEA